MTENSPKKKPKYPTTRAEAVAQGWDSEYLDLLLDIKHWKEGLELTGPVVTNIDQVFPECHLPFEEED